MREESELNRTCYYYEIFMERAFGVYQSSEPGMQASIMQNLIIAEKGRVISVESVAHFQEQLIGMKHYMKKAIDRYMAKPNVSITIIESLKEYKNEILWAVSSDELMRIVHKTIVLTASLNIEMK